MTNTVLITGAAQRIGKEIALTLAIQGWDVVIHYHHSTQAAEQLAQEIEKLGRRAWLVQADLSISSDVARIIPGLGAQGVTLNALINNAATFERDTINTITDTLWHHQMDVNLWAPLQLIRDFTSQYQNTGAAGHIINITDGMHGWSISPTFLSYSLSKLGLDNATRLLARELAPKIQINAIAPGPTLPGKQDKEDTFDKLAGIIPLQHTSTPKEICDAILYLLGTTSITGQIIQLSGGMGCI